MSRNASITVRVDEQTKKEAAAIAHNLGLNLSSAITLFLRQIVIRKEIPLMLTSNAKSMDWESSLVMKADPAHGHVVLPIEDRQDSEIYDRIYVDAK
jgi:addiction module RelB/DinJ family antitoxin